MLTLGISGPLVKNLQNNLHKLGYKLSIGGVYDYETDSVVKQFSQDNNLQYSGYVTDEIKNLINLKLITPVYKETSKEEDFDDSDFISTDLSEFESEIKCDNIQLLIDYISNVKLTRGVESLFLHCTATNQNASVSAIENYWQNVLGWKNPGYHIIVKPNGEWTLLLDFNLISNGVSGHNAKSINISYIGGIDKNGKPKNNITKKQREVFEYIIKELSKLIDGLIVKGHNEVSNKACPSFNVHEVFKK